MSQWIITLGYVAGWVVMLLVFRSIYRWKKGLSKSQFNPWFEINKEKEAYEALLEDESQSTDMLRLALLKRAVTDVKRLWQLSEERSSLAHLVKEGAISDEMWNSFKKAEQDIQMELYEVQAEAEELKEGWGDKIINDAAHLAAKERQSTMVEKEQRRIKKAQLKEKQVQEREKKKKQKEEKEIMDESERLQKELIEEEEREKAMKKKGK